MTSKRIVRLLTRAERSAVEDARSLTKRDTCPCPHCQRARRLARVLLRFLAERTGR